MMRARRLISSGNSSIRRRLGKRCADADRRASRRRGSTFSFYTIVMGGGGDDIHFGIYRDGIDGVRESSAATTAWMMTQLDMAAPPRSAIGCWTSAADTAG